LALPLGVNDHLEKLGVCRSFGDGSSVEDGGQKLWGTAVLEGADANRCFVTRADGTTAVLDGGLFHLLQARPAVPACVDLDEKTRELAAGLSERISLMLTESDRQLIEEVVVTSQTEGLNFSFATLEHAATSLGSCDLEKVMSAARFVHHPLNTLGLHLLRCVLAERMGEARARARGYDLHPDYATWHNDGLLVKDMDDPALGGEEGLLKIFQMVSGEPTLGIPSLPLVWVGYCAMILVLRIYQCRVF